MSTLEKAFEELSKLSEEDQEAFASWILEGLEIKERWNGEPFGTTTEDTEES